MCLCLSEGETVKLVLSLRFNCSGTVKHLLLTHLSLNPSCFYFLFYVLSFYSSLQYTCFFFSVSSRVLHFIFCRLFALFSLCFPASLTVVFMGIMLPCLCLFFFFCSHQFCCFTSGKSAADVHIIPYNTLVINHAALVYRPRWGHRIWPNKWPTYDIRFMDINRQRL